MSLLWNDDLSFLYSGIGICEKTGSFYLREQRAKVRACTRPWRLPR